MGGSIPPRPTRNAIPHFFPSIPRKGIIMTTFDLSEFGATVGAMIDENCPADLECGPADRWHEDVRDEIRSRIDISEPEDADDAISRLEEWACLIDQGDLTEGIWTEIVYSADCEEFVREYEDECDEAVYSMYGDYASFVSSVSPDSFTHLLDALANVGIDHVLREQVYEWASNISADIANLIAEIELATIDDDDI